MGMCGGLGNYQCCQNKNARIFTKDTDLAKLDELLIENQPGLLNY